MTSLTSWAAKITGFSTVVFLIVNCTFTTKRQKLPQFRFGIDTVGHSIDSFVACQHININGVENSTAGKVESELEVDIINGVNIPKDDPHKKALGRMIASRVKSDLRADRQWTGFIFKSDELSE